MDTCIAGGNLRYFFGFVVFAGIAALDYTTLAMVRLLDIAPEIDIISILFLLNAILLTMFVVPLCITHCWFSANNTTTYESSKHSHTHHDGDASHIPSNPIAALRYITNNCLQALQSPQFNFDLYPLRQPDQERTDRHIRGNWAAMNMHRPFTGFKAFYAQ